jgi:hypothetical protein
MGTGGCLPGREADHSLSTSAKVKKTWIYTSTPPCVFIIIIIIIIYFNCKRFLPGGSATAITHITQITHHTQTKHSTQNYINKHTMHTMGIQSLLQQIQLQLQLYKLILIKISILYSKQ